MKAFAFRILFAETTSNVSFEIYVPIINSTTKAIEACPFTHYISL